VAIHCANHRLALCIKDANEDPVCAVWVGVHDAFMTAAYSLVGKSPANSALFSEFCEQLSLLMLSPKKSHKVRWSGRFFCVQQMYECLHAWRKLFAAVAVSKTAKAAARTKAKNLQKAANTYAFVIENAYLFDMCELLHRLTSLLQERDICFERYLSTPCVYASHVTFWHLRHR
jgi:hypothetical protein